MPLSTGSQRQQYDMLVTLVFGQGIEIRNGHGTFHYPIDDAEGQKVISGLRQQYDAAFSMDAVAYSVGLFLHP